MFVSPFVQQPEPCGTKPRARPLRLLEDGSEQPWELYFLLPHFERRSFFSSRFVVKLDVDLWPFARERSRWRGGRARFGLRVALRPESVWGPRERESLVRMIKAQELL